MSGSSSTPARPRQATVAAALIMGGSLIVLVTVFDQIAGLRSLESREGIEDFLSRPPGEGLGLSVEQAFSLLQVINLAAGACATVSAILGYQVLQRSRSARLVLSVLAVPLFLTGAAAGGIMSSVVAAAVVMLWLQPTRDWFDGVTRQRPEPEPRRADPVPPPSSPAPAAGSPASAPRPYQGFGTGQVAAPPAYPATAPAPAPWDAPAPYDAPPGRRPAALVWACVITWVACALTVVAMGLLAVGLAASSSEAIEEVYRQNPELAEQGLSDDMILTTFYSIAAIAALWSLTTIVLAVLTWRRAAWARITLVVSVSGAAAFCLLGMLGSVVMVLPFAACAGTLVLLLRPEVRLWFAPRR